MINNSKNNVDSHYYSGQGVVMLGEMDALTGEVLGLRPIGNVSALAIAISTTRVEHRESQTGSRGTDRVITTEVGASVTMTLENLIQENLALGLYGTTGTVAAETDAKKAVSKVKLGTVVALDHMGITALTVDDGAETPTKTYAEGENYRVNADAGSIYFMTAAEQAAASASTPLAEDDPVGITATSSEYKQLDALTSSSAPIRFLRFEGLNTVEGDAAVVVEVFRFETAPLAEYALINEEISSIALEGTALADTSRNSGSQYFIQKSLK